MVRVIYYIWKKKETPVTDFYVRNTVGERACGRDDNFCVPLGYKFPCIVLIAEIKYLNIHRWI